MKEKLIIKLPNGHKIVAELCEYPHTNIQPEIVVCLQDENGIAIQDLAIVRASENQKNIEVLVWSNKDDEDYTDRFEIEEYKEEEQC